jgi:hypothetical protein
MLTFQEVAKEIFALADVRHYFNHVTVFVHAICSFFENLVFPHDRFEVYPPKLATLENRRQKPNVEVKSLFETEFKLFS